MNSPHGPLRIGIGGPVGAGKTTLTAALCEAFRDDLSMAVVTNDIYTREDADALLRVQALPSDRSRALKPAAVRTRRSARTPRSTSPRSPSFATCIPILTWS